jgi:transcriptional regulator with XRE-family HTH domain
MGPREGLPMNTFGEKLRELRDAAGMTQMDLSARAGVPIGTVRDYEQGSRDPLLSNAQRLAKALNVSLDEFPPTAPRAKKGRGKAKGKKGGAR